MKTCRKPIVVMADDDDDDCTLAREAFVEGKIEGTFHCVRDGMELLDYLRDSCGGGEEDGSSTPALILLDLNMPRKNGRETLKEIKSAPALRNIPVVILSTSQDEKDLVFSRQNGALSFISKPATFYGWVKMMESLTGAGPIPKSFGGGDPDPGADRL